VGHDVVLEGYNDMDKSHMVVFNFWHFHTIVSTDATEVSYKESK